MKNFKFSPIRFIAFLVVTFVTISAELLVIELFKILLSILDNNASVELLSWLLRYADYVIPAAAVMFVVLPTVTFLLVAPMYRLALDKHIPVRVSMYIICIKLVMTAVIVGLWMYLEILNVAYYMILGAMLNMILFVILKNSAKKEPIPDLNTSMIDMQ